MKSFSHQFYQSLLESAADSSLVLLVADMSISRPPSMLSNDSGAHNASG